MRFAYRLAFNLGIVDPVGDILNKIDRRQLAHWMAYLALEPPESERADERASLHTALIANRLRHSDESPVYQPRDLLVDWRARSEPPKPAKPVDPKTEQDAILREINTRFPA